MPKTYSRPSAKLRQFLQVANGCRFVGHGITTVWLSGGGYGQRYPVMGMFDRRRMGVGSMVYMLLPQKACSSGEHICDSVASME